MVVPAGKQPGWQGGGGSLRVVVVVLVVPLGEQAETARSRTTANGDSRRIKTPSSDDRIDSIHVDEFVAAQQNAQPGGPGGRRVFFRRRPRRQETRRRLVLPRRRRSAVQQSNRAIQA